MVEQSLLLIFDFNLSIDIKLMMYCTKMNILTFTYVHFKLVNHFVSHPNFIKLILFSVWLYIPIYKKTFFILKLKWLMKVPIKRFA